MAERFPLNPAQQAAVEHDGGAALVIAGAGSGKTRVLTARVATLLERGVEPEGILAFTFTNRAAREMRARIEQAVGPVASRLWIGTFHATAMRLLRREAGTLGLPTGFTVYDREDQEGLLKRVLKDLGLGDSGYKIGAVLSRISDAKNALVSPEAFEKAALSPFEQRIGECFARYQQGLRRAGALDFDDLIGETVRLLLHHPAAASRWQQRFRHVLVDEYQDTNHAQFRLVQALATGQGNLFVVGDDDQSIYGWRGADLSNVLDFEEAFPGAVTFRLEQNYRSTRTILDAANAMISHNQARKGKTLWSDREAGRPILFTLCSDESDEARRVRGWLEEQRHRGRALRRCAVLYRTNSQSRALETELRQNRMPYEIVGGLSFFQRREVKDVLAYLRLVVNPADGAAFFRIWNTPRRGMGPVVLAAVEGQLAAGAANPIEALRAVRAAGGLKGAARAGGDQLLALLDELSAQAAEPAEIVFGRMLERTGYLEGIEASTDSELAERRANVEELGVAAAQFSAQGRGGLLDWLSECSLLTDADRLHEDQDRVLLLTIHNAKGLEFGAVAIAGLEEGLMPHASSLEDATQLEEERRLFYVALTRAEDEVLLTAASFRRRYTAGGAMGSWGGQVSRFVEEVPPHLLHREGGARSASAERAPERGDSHRTGARGAHARRGTASGVWRDPHGMSRDEVRDLSLDHGGSDVDVIPRVPSARSAESRRAIGHAVFHEKFGRGTVLDAEGGGPDMKLTVRFAGSVKKVLARFVMGGADVDPA